MITVLILCCHFGSSKVRNDLWRNEKSLRTRTATFRYKSTLRQRFPLLKRSCCLKTKCCGEYLDGK